MSKTPSTTNQELTKKQRRTLTTIRDYMAEYGHPPTQQELARRMEISVGTVNQSIAHLEDKGYIKRERNKRRSLAIAKHPPEQPAAQVQIPVLGQISAGPLNYASENVEGHVSVDDYLVRSGDFFGLRVVGDSMKNAGILEGDVVVVRRQVMAENGDIVVARLGEDATVKRLRYVRSQVWLEPENENYSPIEVTPDQGDEFAILGRVIAHVRPYRE